MPSPSRAATRKLWRDRVRRLEASDLTVTQFCANEDCSAAAFYRWRRKLRLETQQTETSEFPSPAGFVPVKLPSQAGGQFAGSNQPLAPESPPSTVMSVELPGGIRVRLEVASNDRKTS